MTAFRVGQLVVLRDDDWSDAGLFGHEQRPVKGPVYTVRAVDPFPFGPFPHLLLEEIRNKPHSYVNGVHECAFRASHFRPVQPTSIEWAHELVNDLPKQKQTETV